MKKLAKLNSRPFEYIVYDGTNDEELKAFAGTVVASKELGDGRQLNFFMMAKWPDEQMGPKKEGEQK